ncbi:MAG TPA: ABC transporter ATP-binding protein [Lachnospiraceae bacterium]|nr:ABC transporter ATP-binding protein [Lachnospiraceae bacterium]HIS61686.1 ABC transporter ATP-binding protein [Candidatus Scybalomonas excrementigallinarum]
MLKIKQLCKYYGDFLAVDHLDLDIQKGEIFGFVGPNGAGKTTTMKIAAGLLKETSGEIWIDGINARKNENKIKQKIGYMPDFFGVYENLKVIEYIEFYASMYGIVGKEGKRRAREMLEIVDLLEKENSYVDGLSRGMKQRLCLARSMVHNPEVLILDEPASGLDPRARHGMKEILKSLKQFEKTIVVSSHILQELAEICTTVGIMDRGKLLVYGSIDNVLMQVKEKNTLKIQVYAGKEKVLRLLKENPKVERVSILQDCLKLSFKGTEEEEAKLLRSLIEGGADINSFVRERGDLEELFMTLTEEGEGEHENQSNFK